MKHPNPMTPAKKTVVWTMWRKGRPMAEIAKAIVKPPATVFSYLQYHGGFPPRLQKRREIHLSVDEREIISRSVASGLSLRAIAAALDRSPSTISREIRRNGGKEKYRAFEADRAAFKRAKRPKKLLLASNTKLKGLVTQKLSEDWSPEQIAGWLAVNFPNCEGMRVSHETIYRSLFIHTRGLLNKQLRNHLRTKRKFRHSRHHQSGYRSRIFDGITISDRPAEVQDRAIPGHWEGDLITGSQNTHIATVVERSSRFTVLVKVQDKTTEKVVTALSKKMAELPDLLRKSLTWDRGQELASHKTFTVMTDMNVYFCDPSSPWQRGTNENTNGLLRQYFPKGTSLSGYSQHHLDQVADKLNHRPRKTLGYKSPAMVLNEVLR